MKLRKRLYNINPGKKQLEIRRRNRKRLSELAAEELDEVCEQQQKPSKIRFSDVVTTDQDTNMLIL